MTETKNPLATALGTYYPAHDVVAVVDDPAGATRALAALREGGFSDATAELCPGAEFPKNYREFVEGRGLWQRPEGLFPSEEQAAVAEYAEEAERGASFVTVHAPEPGEWERARGLLKANGGHAMRYDGDNTIVDLG